MHARAGRALLPGGTAGRGPSDRFAADDQLDAAILLTAGGRVVGGHRAGFRRTLLHRRRSAGSAAAPDTREPTRRGAPTAAGCSRRRRRCRCGLRSRSSDPGCDARMPATRASFLARARLQRRAAGVEQHVRDVHDEAARRLARFEDHAELLAQPLPQRDSFPARPGPRRPAPAACLRRVPARPACIAPRAWRPPLGRARLLGVGLRLQRFLTRALDVEPLALGGRACRRGVLCIDAPPGAAAPLRRVRRSRSTCAALALGLRAIQRRRVRAVRRARAARAWNSSSCRCSAISRASSAVCAAWRAGIMISLPRLRFSRATSASVSSFCGLGERVGRVAICAGQTRQLHRVPRLGQIERRAGLEWLHLEVAHPGSSGTNRASAARTSPERSRRLPLVSSRTTFSMTTTSLGCVTAK